MKSVHTIVAVVLALLIASPLCCCVGSGAGDAPAVSCCSQESDGEKTPGERHACACKSKEPREVLKDIELPAPAVQMLPPASVALPRLPVIFPGPAAAAVGHTGCDPPRALLARYARWLI